MPNFKKVLSLKLLILFIAGIFFINNTAYGVDAQVKSLLLRPPILMQKGNNDRRLLLSMKRIATIAFLAIAPPTALGVNPEAATMPKEPATIIETQAGALSPLLGAKSSSSEIEIEKTQIRKYFSSVWKETIGKSKVEIAGVAVLKLNDSDAQSLISAALQYAGKDFSEQIIRLINFLQSSHDRPEIDKGLIQLLNDYFLPRNMCITLDLYLDLSGQWQPDITVFNADEVKEVFLESRKITIVYSSETYTDSRYGNATGFSLRNTDIIIINLRGIENSADLIMRLTGEDLIPDKTHFVNTLKKFTEIHELVHKLFNTRDIAPLSSQQLGVDEKLWNNILLVIKKRTGSEVAAYLNIFAMAQQKNELKEMIAFLVHIYWSSFENNADHLALRYVLNSMANIPSDDWIDASQDNANEAQKLFDKLLNRKKLPNEAKRLFKSLFPGMPLISSKQQNAAYPIIPTIGFDKIEQLKRQSI